MKKRIEIIIIICLAISTLVFGVLWQSAEKNNEDIKLLAQSSAADAYTDFTDYQNNGHESSYWSGVANFRSFQQAYYLMTEGTNKSTNYIFCNEVYGYLVLSPEESQGHISEVIEVMEILAQNVEDENGYIRMSELRNLFKHN